MADDDPGLTPEQEQRVRRLLTDARHTEPMPGDVAARLDRVLAELAHDEEVAPPVPLTSRRRRRAVTMLVAAAAVVVGGIGLGQVLGSTGGDQDSMSTVDRASGAEDAPSATDSGAATNGGADSLTPTPPNGVQDGRSAYALPGPVRVRSQRFASDVRHVQRLLAARATAPNHHGTRVPAFSCKPGDWGAGLFVPASYRGEPTVLVFRPVRGDTQVVDLFQCDSDEALRSVTLPAR
jgi:hypothetical protein